MSFYTTLYLVPLDSPDWIPRWEFIKDVMDCLGAICVYNAVGYLEPLYWENWDDNAHHKVLEQLDWRESLDVALDVLTQVKPVSVMMHVFANGLVDDIFNSLAGIPESVGHNVVIGNLSVHIGPFSVPSVDWATTVGRFCFGIALSGSGVPYEPGRYLEAVRNDPKLRQFLALLWEKSEKQWDVLISCYC